MFMTRLVSRIPVIAALLALAANSAKAQWVVQSFQLTNGYNAIYLEIEPSPVATADQVFVTSPPNVITSVSTWLPPGTSAQADDPTTGDSQWRVWSPAGSAAAAANSVYRVNGGQVHLIQATIPNNGTATLTVVGRPFNTRSRWQVGQNVNGFHVEAGGTMTFGQYLAPSSAFDTDVNTAGQQLQIYQMNSAGDLVAVANAANAVIVPGRAYWVQCLTPVDYDGPVDIDDRTTGGISFGRSQSEHRVELKNLATVARNLTFTVTNSFTPPVGTPALPSDVEGAIPLQYRDYSSATSIFSRVALAIDAPLTMPFPAAPTTANTLNPTKVLWLSCVRAGRAAATVDPATGLGSQYQSVLVVRDGTGYRRWLPITAEVGSRAGLYVGSVTLSKVQWVQADARILETQPPAEDFSTPGGVDDDIAANPSADNDTTVLRKTAQPFSFPVIVHYDGVGGYRFLSSVTLRSRPAVGTTPAHLVLATPSCPTCGNLPPAGLSGAASFPVRFSTAAFSFQSDLPMVGGFDSQLSLATPLTIGPTDPLNPFRHKFHPHHNAALGGTVLSFTRAPVFSFGACADLIGATPADAGTEVLRGCYSETFTGLHKRSIQVGGTFELRRVSDVAVLNDGN